MFEMSLKLVLAWLCCVMVWFGVVLGSSIDSSASLDGMELSPGVKLWSRLAQTSLEDNSRVEMDNLHLYGLVGFNSEIPEHQIPIMRKAITACLDLLGIMVQPLIGDQLIESRNPDGSIGCILEMNSKKDQIQMIEDMQIVELADYLYSLRGMPGVYEVATMYNRQAVKVGTTSFCIPPAPKLTFNLTSTEPSEELTIYQKYLEVLKPLKKITSPDQMMIFGQSTENGMLGQLELLFFLLRITISPTIIIDWLDKSISPLDVKLIDRFRPLLKDIPTELKRRKFVINVDTSCNGVFWNAFRELIIEHYDTNPLLILSTSVA
ncbi:hypothetical protein NEHOM01_2132 [Nematocida homosporus]|uniref:uncharacterized protein n=1 Tax=Nematocida homosporus TaxID=1912981 RepID=UPI00221FDC7C|nr:uncharacterized protein NEHOM01_2132 [Nematocida homosporus]KAI5187378.1 hypothetical protein NEHOM01_2132 [Nematocida homosporus]